MRSLWLIEGYGSFPFVDHCIHYLRIPILVQRNEKIIRCPFYLKYCSALGDNFLKEWSVDLTGYISAISSSACKRFEMTFNSSKFFLLDIA